LSVEVQVALYRAADKSTRTFVRVQVETSSQLCLVLTTWPADRDSDALAAALVSAQLAACVNVFAPMTSHYMWEGRLERAQEVQLVLKTTPARLAALTERLRALHPYEVPEIVVLEATASAAYGDWVTAAVAPP
jgi:periplasmic divalent cation tolerance protein